jgi:hypothetical protein
VAHPKFLNVLQIGNLRFRVVQMVQVVQPGSGAPLANAPQQAIIHIVFETAGINKKGALFYRAP